MLKKFVFYSLILFSLETAAQIDSINQTNCSYQISLLTCSPGEELYTTFGHSAIRILNSQTGSDLVFNYGTFDFEDPDFYQKFIEGKLLYFVSVDSMRNFLWEYQYYQRGITEQILNLTCEEKEKIVRALFENAKNENKFYRYNFTFDNCTTRIRDLLEKNSTTPIQTKNILPTSTTTFRNLLHESLNNGNRDWSKLGIDILLGSSVDTKISNREAMFLPNYLLNAVDSSKLKNEPLVKEKSSLLPSTYLTKDSVSPLLVFSALLIIIVALSFFKSFRVFFIFFDCLLFFTCGTLGVLLLFLWVQNEQAMFQNNFNLLWALPTHLIAPVLLFTKNQWLKNYFKFSFFFTLTVLLVWAFLPQQMNPALLPLVGIILVRSYQLLKPRIG